jgi:hypothetical protein
MNIGRKKQFTIIEGIKMFNIINSSNKNNMEKSSFWEKIYNQGMIPERNPDQLKKFWL